MRNVETTLKSRQETYGLDDMRCTMLKVHSQQGDFLELPTLKKNVREMQLLI